MSKLSERISRRLQKGYITFMVLFFGLPLCYYGYLFFMNDFNPSFVFIEKCLEEKGCWDYKLKKCVDIYSKSTLQCQRIDN
jgi:hypothetical protein